MTEELIIARGLARNVMVELHPGDVAEYVMVAPAERCERVRRPAPGDRYRLRRGDVSTTMTVIGLTHRGLEWRTDEGQEDFSSEAWFIVHYEPVVEPDGRLPRGPSS